jgi:Glucose / Sorbosone dehydrogenase
VSTILRRLLWPIAAWVALTLVPASSHAAIRLSPVGSFSAPTSVAAAPGDVHRLYVVQRGGAIRVVRDGTVLPTPFVDLAGEVSANDERGLLSMAFPPDFQTSRLFYVYFTDLSGNVRVDQLRASTDDQANSTATYHHTVISIPHPASNHNGWDGSVRTGRLPLHGAWRRRDLVKRSEPEHPARQGAVGAPPPRGRWLRHPGRQPVSLLADLVLRAPEPLPVSFDRATGDLTIADVGELTTEEVDFAPRSSGSGRGPNFGWPSCEGSFVTGSTRARSRAASSR